eukprot:CAMPEP_0119073818 /NCGR_PEP_ID=MMETSP1178-20130426/69130_1 /TAXON_ID=33656 /ORGANISM="unid sp, Strain CCMP2000" /LENGTH=67 /DNA_ID=CAMNT_0007055935 /DNA_START=1 /DNA_END=200 /DNA_ORIENTATION=+
MKLIKGKLNNAAPPLPDGVSGTEATTEEIFVQRESAGGLIGKAGAKIAELRELTRCQIKILENPEPG